jgi:hypothetical protein
MQTIWQRWPRWKAGRVSDGSFGSLFGIAFGVGLGWLSVYEISIQLAKQLVQAWTVYNKYYSATFQLISQPYKLEMGTNLRLEISCSCRLIDKRHTVIHTHQSLVSHLATSLLLQHHQPTLEARNCYDFRDQNTSSSIRLRSTVGSRWGTQTLSRTPFQGCR